MPKTNIFKTRYNRYIIKWTYLIAWLLIVPSIAISHIRKDLLTNKQMFLGMFLLLGIYLFLLFFRCPKCNWRTMRKTNGQDNTFSIQQDCTICKYEYL